MGARKKCASMKKCRQLLDKNCVVYPGHAYNGNFSTIERNVRADVGNVQRAMDGEAYLAVARVPTTVGNA